MLPHGLLLVVRAKSPLVAMLLIFRVALPVLERVTLLPLLVVPTTSFPNESEAGVRVTIGPVAPVIVSWIVVACVSEPDVPVMVTVEVPLAAEAPTVKVRVLVVEVGFGENAADTPLGKPLALKVTLLLKPLTGTTVMVLVPLLPCAMLTEDGFAVRLKSALATTFTVTGADSIPLATTYRLYAPAARPDGTSNSVEFAVNGAIECVVSS